MRGRASSRQWWSWHRRIDGDGSKFRLWRRSSSILAYSFDCESTASSEFMAKDGVESMTGSLRSNDEWAS
jgi:hypothetical protein